MSPTWDDGTSPELGAISPLGYLRAFCRGVPLVLLLILGLALTLILRPFERLIARQSRPLTPYITCAVCTGALALMGIKLRRIGTPMKGAGAVVANHSSWLDIFALNARKRVYFVAKSEVEGWAGIGWLARATGTVFIKRDRREARTQVAGFRTRLAAGHKLLFFPEGTSTDGQRVLPFRTTLFAAFFDESLRDTMRVQPVTLLWHGPKGADHRFYGWWGGMDLGPHLLAVLAQRPQGRIDIHYHRPLKVADFPDRKALAKALEDAVRAPFLVS
ncbi:MAG: lysophospholipid acyltransferase family protein [Maritimibacter sp.]